MLVSFIIPHKGREELLEQTLRSILQLEFDLAKIELIIVTQNATLECTYIDRNAVNFHLIFRPINETISALRNTGVARASGEYLVFLDADIQLSRNWLHMMFEELQANPRRVLASAVQRYGGPNAGGIEKIKSIMSNTSADRVVEFLGTANLFMSRQTFENVGGFPEEMMTCEDYYFTSKVHQIGELYYTSQASFIHLGEDKSYAELFRKEIWRGQSNLQSLKGRKIMLREIPSIFTPLWQAFFLLVTIFTVLLGELLTAFFCLVMVCLPGILYAIRLYKAGRPQVSFMECIWFYCVYHSARVIGTIIGVFKTIKT